MYVHAPEWGASSVPQAHRTASGPPAEPSSLWARAGFARYEGVSRVTPRAVPHGGTPCVPLLSARVCLGHFRSRQLGSYPRSTYFHFFYAVGLGPPFAITNVSTPFRLRRASSAERGSMLGERGAAMDPEGYETEAVQFAAGLVQADGTSLLVSYGLGDCVGALRQIRVDDVAALLAGRLALDVL